MAHGRGRPSRLQLALESSRPSRHDKGNVSTLFHAPFSLFAGNRSSSVPTIYFPFSRGVRSSRGGGACPATGTRLTPMREPSIATLAPIDRGRLVGHARSMSIRCWKCSLSYDRAPQRHSIRATPPRGHAVTARLLPCTISGTFPQRAGPRPRSARRVLRFTVGPGARTCEVMCVPQSDASRAALASLSAPAVYVRCPGVP